MNLLTVVKLPVRNHFLPFFFLVNFCTFALSQQVGPGIGADTRDARQIFRLAAENVKNTKTVSYKATYQGTGAFSTHTQTVRGTVALEKLNPDNPFKAKFAINGERFPAGTDELQRFNATFDGLVINKLRPKEHLLLKKTISNTVISERSLGFVTSFFRGGAYQIILFDWVLDEPFAVQLKASTVDYEGTTTVEGVLCHVIFVDHLTQFENLPRTNRERWYIGMKDNLPRKFEQLAFDDKGRHGSYALTISGLRVNEKFANSIFRIKLPKGYAIESFKKEIYPELLPVNSIAPDWKLSDSQKKEHQLSEFRGRVVILDFWATWCGPCIRGMPFMQKLNDKYRSRDVVVIGINVLEESNPTAYMKQRKFDYGLLLKGEEVANVYRAKVLPTLYIIGRDGKIIYHSHTPDEKDVESVLENYLSNNENTNN